MRCAFFMSMILGLVSCTGPQMIDGPQFEVHQTQSDDAEVVEEIDTSSEAGVFDGHHQSLRVNHEQWKLISDSNGIQTYQKIKSNSGLVAFRGETIIQAPLSKVASILNNDALQKEWV